MTEKTTSSLLKRNRTKTITLRLDPLLLYLTELTARLGRRTMTSVIETALQHELERTVLKEVRTAVPKKRTNDLIELTERALHPPEPVYETKQVPVYSQEIVNQLWHVYEPDRVIQLALFDRRLLNFDEQLMWTVVHDTPLFWNPAEDGRRYISIESLNRPALRQKWEQVKKIALEGADSSLLESDIAPGEDVKKVDAKPRARPIRKLRV